MGQIIKADLDEMVFEDRERRYGAYFLRKVYPGHLAIGTAIVSIAFLLYTFLPLTMKAEEVEEAKVVAVTISMEDLPPPPPLEEENKPPPPPPLPAADTSLLSSVGTCFKIPCFVPSSIKLRTWPG